MTYQLYNNEKKYKRTTPVLTISLIIRVQMTLTAIIP